MFCFYFFDKNSCCIIFTPSLDIFLGTVLCNLFKIQIKISSNKILLSIAYLVSELTLNLLNIILFNSSIIETFSLSIYFTKISYIEYYNSAYDPIKDVYKYFYNIYVPILYIYIYILNKILFIEYFEYFLYLG